MRRLWLALLGAALAVPALAQTPEAPLATRAQVRSINKDGDGKTYIALKVMPRTKLPFSSLTFLVRNPGQVEGVAVGDEVFFTGARIDGENTLQSLRKTTPCVRFQPCKQHD